MRKFDAGKLEVVREPEAGLFDFWKEVEYYELQGVVFFEIGNMDWGKFIDFYERHRKSLYFVRYDGVPAAFYWLTHRERTAARLHFCTFPSCRRYLLGGTCYILADLLKHYRVLWAVVPANNKKAGDFTLAVGFDYLGYIPDYYDAGIGVDIFIKHRGFVSEKGFSKIG
jgi:hypothetical protein